MTEMGWTILLVGSFVAASCSLVGCFLVLRRTVLLGDALSHSVLPGIAIAFFLTESRASVPMVLGAGAFGVFTVFLVELLNRTRRLHEDASIGVVFPALFAFGVLLISRYARQVHLDIDCVLFGEIAYTPLDLWFVAGKSWGPRALWITGFILAFDIAVVLIFYKELKVTTFDADLAASLGISPLFFHYVLMSAVSVTIVGAFESVGAILVVAMLAVPAATAYLWTHRLRSMLLLAVFFGLISAWSGYLVARILDCSIAGAMAAMAGVYFFLTLLLSPDYGLVARGLSHRRLRLQLQTQLLMLHLQTGGEAADYGSVLERFAWTSADLWRVLQPLLRADLVARSGESLRLTPEGEDALERWGTAPLAHRTTK